MASKKPSVGFKGYSLKVAILRNKDAIKLYIGAVGAINLFPPFDWHTLALTLGVGFFGLLTKIAADAVDYYYDLGSRA